MKKSFMSFVILLVIVVLCLTSCNISSITNMLDVYAVTVTGDTLHLAEPLSPFYKAGDVVCVKSHLIVDASIHVFVNNVEVESKRSESGMEYSVYEFVMPAEDITVHITMDPFYGRDEYTFDELLSWVRYLDYNSIDRVSVKTRKLYHQYSLVETRYSTKQEDIDNFKAILSQGLHKEDLRPSSEADFSYTYTFSTKLSDDKYNRIGDIEFRDDYFHHLYNETSYPRDFSFTDQSYALPTIEDPDLITYSFDTWAYQGGRIYLKMYDDEAYSMEYSYLGAVEFKLCDRPVPDVSPVYYLDGGFGKITILTDTVFEYYGQYYEVVIGNNYWVTNYIN